MKRLSSLFILVSCLTLLGHCSAAKPPEPAAIESRNVLTALRDLDKAYEAKDLSAFMASVAPQFSDRAGLEKALAAVFAKYDRIVFTIQYAKMDIFVDLQGRKRTSFTWDAEWHAPNGTTVKDGGRITLVFEAGDYKLLMIDGKNPFLAQPGETPGGK